MTAHLEEAIVSYLSGYSGLTSLVSTRVYPMRAPQSVTVPYVLVQRISTPRMLTQDMSGATGTLAHPRIQIEGWAETYLAAKAITDQVRAAMNGKTGSIGSGAHALTIGAALIDDEQPEFEPEVNLYRSRCDFIVWHEE